MLVFFSFLLFIVFMKAMLEKGYDSKKSYLLKSNAVNHLIKLSALNRLKLVKNEELYKNYIRADVAV